MEEGSRPTGYALVNNPGPVDQSQIGRHSINLYLYNGVEFACQIIGPSVFWLCKNATLDSHLVLVEQ